MYEHVCRPVSNLQNFCNLHEHHRNCHHEVPNCMFSKSQNMIIRNITGKNDNNGDIISDIILNTYLRYRTDSDRLIAPCEQTFKVRSHREKFPL